MGVQTFSSALVVPILCYAIRQVSDKSQDLVVVYSWPITQVTLEQYLQSTDSLPLPSDEVNALMTSVVYTLYTASRFSGEYMHVSPQDIVVDTTAPQHSPSRFLLSNWGLQRAKKFEKRTANPQDKAHSKTLNRDKNYEAIIRGSVFSLGMLALWLLTGSDPNEHYSLNGVLKEHSVTQEALGGLFTQHNVPSDMQKVVVSMLQREEARVTVEQLVKADQLNNQLEYFQGNLEGKCTEYNGFMKDGEYQTMGDLQTIEGDSYRGGFNKGEYSGYGTLLLHNTHNILRGHFTNNTLSKGVLIA